MNATVCPFNVLNSYLLSIYTGLAPSLTYGPLGT